MLKFDYDVLIVGGGSAGLTAAIYAVRYNLKTLVVSSDFGGQILSTGDIENWPGIKSITGPALSEAYREHAESLGAKLVTGFVQSIKKESAGFSVKVDGLGDGNSELHVKAIILCAGAKHKKLGIPGEEALAGRGVSYCATCDGPFFKNKVVAVVGGGDAAINGALDVAVHAAKVYLIHRSADFRAKPAYVDMARKDAKIEFILGTNLVEAKGGSKLESVVLDKPYNGSTELQVDGVFIEIGFLPETKLAKELGLEFDDQGYVAVFRDQATNLQGIYAAGDITNASNRFSRLVTASAEGAIAAEAVFRYIRGLVS